MLLVVLVESAVTLSTTVVARHARLRCALIAGGVPRRAGRLGAGNIRWVPVQLLRWSVPRSAILGWCPLSCVVVLYGLRPCWLRRALAALALLLDDYFVL